MLVCLACLSFACFLILQLNMFIQLKNIMAPSAADPKGAWKSCKLDLTKCSADQLKTVQGELYPHVDQTNDLA